MANKTILKWAGSKVQIMPQLLPHLPKTRRLVEPFAGYEISAPRTISGKRQMAKEIIAVLGGKS